MSAFQRVVVGIDASQCAADALRWAADRVPDLAGIEVVHAGTTSLRMPTGLDVASIRVIDDKPARALMHAAKDINADAIVIGPHGSGFGLGLGSVAKRLLAESPVPVIVVEEHEPPRTLGLRPPVVACVGYGDPATAASQWAADFAEQQSLPLVLLHSVAYRPIFPIDSGSDVLASYLGTGISLSWARDELESMADELRTARPELDVSTHVEPTSVIKAVRRAGEIAELVVLGKRSEEEFLHTIGTPRLRRLVARSRFPTAVVPPNIS